MVQAAATTIYRRHNRNSIASEQSDLFKRNVPSLEKMLWGGTVMLIVDHIINGELSWSFPFFTALNETGGVSVFLNELLTVGVPMSLAITAFWAAWSYISARAADKSAMKAR